jgi:hypothetical protein
LTDLNRSWPMLQPPATGPRATRSGPRLGTVVAALAASALRAHKQRRCLDRQRRPTMGQCSQSTRKRASARTRIPTRAARRSMRTVRATSLTSHRLPTLRRTGRRRPSIRGRRAMRSTRGERTTARPFRFGRRREPTQCPNGNLPEETHAEYRKRMGLSCSVCRVAPFRV